MRLRTYVEPVLRGRVEPALELVPNYWSFESIDERPDTHIIGGGWGDFEIPEEDGNLFVFDASTRQMGRYAGGTVGSRIGVAVWPSDSLKRLYLRVWHEALHAARQNSDLLGEEFPRFLGPVPEGVFRLDRWVESRFGFDLVAPSLWQEAYYAWLTRRLVA